jgi:hypothetical protein
MHERAILINELNSLLTHKAPVLYRYVHYVYLVRTCTVPVFVQNSENTDVSSCLMPHASCMPAWIADANISIFIICKVCREEKQNPYIECNYDERDSPSFIFDDYFYSTTDGGGC